MSNLVHHARRELELIGEDPETVDGLLKVVEAFAAMGHSGGSAWAALGQLERLLRYEPLSPLTDDPGEWMHIAEEIAGEPSLWQSRRNPEAFSHDGGKTYYLLSEREAAGDGVAPLHTALTRDEVLLLAAPDPDLEQRIDELLTEEA